MKKYLISKEPLIGLAALLVAILVMPNFVSADITDCKPGYVWQRMSGVGCVQENCNDVPNAHYSYTSQCICGSSGSINENPEDPNKACYHGQENESCPGCLYACVHIDEKCPGTQPASTEDSENGTTDVDPVFDDDSASDDDISADEDADNNDDDDNDDDSNDNDDSNDDEVSAEPSSQQASSPNLPLSTTASVKPGRTCRQECEKWKKGPNDVVLNASGTYPDCKCTVDKKNKNNQLTETVVIDGENITTYVFDPATDRLIKKTTINMADERERIRQSLGNKYTPEEIDILLEEDTINKWFGDKMNNIETQTSILHPQFWWQHMVALWDHGYGNSADFVDTYNFGRCGDSMQWLEQNLASQLELDGDVGDKSEAFLSITGEKYGNAINHTALFIRPPGFSGVEWADAVRQLQLQSGKTGFDAASLETIDQRLLDAKVLDPYFKKTTTVREFIKGWSVIKIS